MPTGLSSSLTITRILGPTNEYEISTSGIPNEVGTFPVTLNLTTTDGTSNVTSLAGSSTVTVNPVVATVNIPIVANTELAYFTDSHDIQVADFSATINYGDGSNTVSIPIVADSSGVGFDVVTTLNASHTYTTIGTYTATITITNSHDGFNTVITDTVDVGNAITATQGVPVSSNIVLAQYTLPNGTFPANYSATIDWANGADTTGQIVSIDGGTAIDIQAEATDSYSYSQQGVYSVGITITDTQTETVAATFTDTAYVGATVSTTAGIPISNQTVLAEYTPIDQNTGFTASNFTASVNWNGTGQSPAQVVVNNGNLEVLTEPGGFTYSQTGTYSPTITIKDSMGDVVANFTDVIYVGNTISATAGVPFSTSTLLAQYSDPNTNVSLNASELTTTITWNGSGVGSTSGTASGSGPFNIEGSFAYTSTGTYTANVEVTNSQDSVVANFTDIIYVGTAISGTEGVTISNQTPLAVYTDPDPNNSGLVASDFTATISWGGTGSGSTLGQVIADGSSFEVIPYTGSFTYTNSGTYTVGVTITDNQDSVTANFTDVAYIGNTIEATQNTTLSNTTTMVTKYVDPNPNVSGLPPSDFTATINWGDGSANTQGQVITDGSGYDVEAAQTAQTSHTYTTAGTYTATITLTDTADNVSSTFTDQVYVGPILTPTQNTPISDTTVLAQYIDPNASTDGLTASSFSATINWGNGDHSTGTLTNDPVKGYDVNISSATGYTFSAGGTYNSVITITESGTTVATFNDIAYVGQAISAVEGVSVPTSTLLATFKDPNASTDGLSSSDLTAVVQYTEQGNLTSITLPTGSVTGSNGDYLVNGGGFTFDETGLVSFTVTLENNTNHNANVATFDDVADVGSTLSATAGIPISNTTVLTQYTDPNASTDGLNASDFSATINWGNGNQTNGRVVSTGTSGLYDIEPVLGSYAYPSGGTYNVTLNVLENSTTVGTFTDVAYVGEAISATEGIPLSNNTLLASYTNTSLTGTVTASINLEGSGSGSIDQVVDNSGTYNVDGSFTYTSAGTDTVLVTIKDNGSTVATFTDVAYVGSTISTTAGVTITNQTALADYTDLNPNETLPASDFTATISWGGSGSGNSTGVVSGSGGNYEVTTLPGGFTYADGGTYPITVTITDTVDNVSATFKDVAYVGTTINATQGVTLPSTTALANYIDQNPNISGSNNYSYTVTWDSANDQTMGSIFNNSTGSFTVENGFTYPTASTPNTYTVNVSVTDPDGVVANFTDIAYVGTTLSATEGTPISTSTEVAYFIDPNAASDGLNAGDLTAYIQWVNGGGEVLGVVSNDSSGQGYDVKPLLPYTYSSGGTDNPVIVTIENNQDNNAVIATFNDIAYVGQSITATQGVAVPNTTLLAQFDDPNASSDGANSSDLTATVQWQGSNLTLPTGAVTGSNGDYTVTGGGFTFTNDTGNVPFTVMIENNANNNATLATFDDNAVVSSAFTNGTAVNITATENVSTGSIPVGSFDDAIASDSISTVTINWGDGNTSTLTSSTDPAAFSENSNVLDITGTHTYAAFGNYAATVTVTDSSGNTITIDDNVVVKDVITAAGTTQTITENTAYNEVDLGTFTPDGSISDYQISTSTLPAGLTLSSSLGNLGNGSYEIYATGTPESGSFGSYSITVDITTVDSPTGTPTFGSNFGTESYSTTVNVNDNYSTSGATTTVNENTPYNSYPNVVDLGTFTPDGSISSPNDYSISTSTLPTGLTLSSSLENLGGGTYEIYATGTPTQAVANDPISILISTVDGPTGSGNFGSETIHSTLTVNPLTAEVPTTIISNEVISSSNPVLVGTFTDANLVDTTSNISASISWGDGSNSTSADFITEITGTGSNTFEVWGDHTYSNAGNYAVTLTVTDTTTSNGTFTVALNPTSIENAEIHNLLFQSVGTQSIPAGINSTVELGTFTDSYPDATASDYLASANNLPSGLTVSSTVEGTYEIYATGTPTQIGTYNNVTPLISLVGSSTTAYNGQNDTSEGLSMTIDVINASSNGTIGNINATEGLSTGSIVVGFFEDAIANDTFTSVTINWGDGNTSTLTSATDPASYTESNNVVSILGTHTYDAFGNYAVTITATDSSDNQISINTTNTVDNAVVNDVFATSATTATITENTAYNAYPNVVDLGTFTPDGSISDYSISTSALPAGLTLSSTPENLGNGTYEIYATGTPETGTFDSYSIAVDITTINSSTGTPAFGTNFGGESYNTTVKVNDNFSVTGVTTPITENTSYSTIDLGTVTTADGSVGDYTVSAISGLPSWLTLSSQLMSTGVTGQFEIYGTGTPPPDSFGSYSITLSVEDTISSSGATGDFGTADNTASPTTLQVNDVFTVAGTTPTVAEGTSNNTIDLGTVTADGSSTAYTVSAISGLPSWITLSSQLMPTGTYGVYEIYGTGTPPNDSFGSYSIALSVEATTSDANGSTGDFGTANNEASPTTLTVNDVFTVSGATTTLIENTAYNTIDLGTVMTADGTVGDYTVSTTSSLPTGLTLSSTLESTGVTGQFEIYATGTPTQAVNNESIALSVTATDSPTGTGNFGIENGTASLTVNPLSNETPATIAATEGQSTGSILVGSFEDFIANDSFSSITVDWGDSNESTLSSTPAVTFSESSTANANGTYTVDVLATHTYADFGYYAVTVTATDSNGYQITVNPTQTDNATVFDAPLSDLTTAGQTIDVYEYTPLTNITVAEFQDTNNNSSDSPADYTATIHWGDGTTSTGSLTSVGDETFTVEGTHTYISYRHRYCLCRHHRGLRH